ncbi:MAG: ATP-binding protein [Candidatus Latescibacteria bacterium]|jgi:signal transduction histidine kinase/CheY-like chemotaxis protein|nr:ATP-binding protein [Candidatus Latescibacterota bacterium]
MSEGSESREELLEATEDLRRRLAEAEARERRLLERIAELEAEGASAKGDPIHGQGSELEIVRLERLEALGDMARGVAHNFNNILVGVLGYAQLIETQSQDPQTVENASEIAASALRAKELVRRLNLSVGRAADTPAQLVDDLNGIVLDAVEATRPKWVNEARSRGVSVAVRTHLGEVPPVTGHVVGLHQILVHLITNAVDAMPEGGAITISTHVSGDRVALEVSDTGVGMDAQRRQRIFEPFYTTKHDVGSGLGLSMVYRTVLAWDGRIEVDSAPGQGSTFKIQLPTWVGEASVEVEQPAPPTAEGGRVLVIDDEKTIHLVLKQALRRHAVSVFTSGDDALRALEKDEYDVALIDLGLPGISGDEVALRIKERDARVVTVLCTGWDLPAGDPRLSAFELQVNKPFRIAEIQKTVDRALAMRRDGEG